ncbi:ACBP-domain-containing protein [Auriscalpium vulgare]|uniref:ACBP-domain-containing protein n=1 Tax=Auriscalpium vulgare TaxID=40419 RepID=A0ACB8RTW2_9AGAM|nr:ACBP-domain-containing protein [Auriscalpium vulgare]
MDTHTLIDSQFIRAVEIIQSLPKTGPIQTDYEEKLAMYSLYKQATVGNVMTPRPGIWDMLGRAKWDAWAKHKDLDRYEAKWLYVDALLKVLGKYSDKTVARDLVRELEAFEGDPSNIMMSGSLSNRSPDTDSSDSEDGHHELGYHSGQVPAHLKNQLSLSHISHTHDQHDQPGTSDEETSEDDGQQPAPLAERMGNRPQSSVSSHRYRTPMAGSMSVSARIPSSQPQPGFHTPSAFAGPSSPSLPPSSAPTAYSGQLAHVNPRITSPPTFPGQPSYMSALGPRQYALPGGLPARPVSRSTLEQAIESVQTQLAALTERIEALERRSISAWPEYSSPGPSRSNASPVGAGRRSPAADNIGWNLDDMGLWTVVFKVLSRVLQSLRQLAGFFADNRNKSPTLIIIRRLFLDISFLICVLAFIRSTWKRSGVRRQEVSKAFSALWWAIVGRTPPRVMAERGV